MASAKTVLLCNHPTIIFKLKHVATVWCNNGNDKKSLKFYLQ